MNKNCIRILIIVFCCIFIIIPSINTSATAPTVDNTQPNYENITNYVTEIDDDKEKQGIGNITKEYIRKNKIDIKNEHFDYFNAKLYRVNNTSLKAYIIPIKGSNQKFHEISNLTIFYNDEYSVDTYTELHVKESNLGTFQVSYYSNGQEIANEITKDTFITAKEYQEQEDSDSELSSYPIFQTKGVNWGGIAKCLGISWSVGAVLAAVCGTACVLSAGTACVICIGAYLGFDIASITGCIAGNTV